MPNCISGNSNGRMQPALRRCRVVAYVYWKEVGNRVTLVLSGLHPEIHGGSLMAKRIAFANVVYKKKSASK